MSKKSMTKRQKTLFKRLHIKVQRFLVELFSVEELSGMFENEEQLMHLNEQASFELAYGSK